MTKEKQIALRSDLTPEYRGSTALAESTLGSALPIEVLAERKRAIDGLLKDLMKKDRHFGVIPGCGDKQVLFKAGAEMICSLFRIVPEYEVDERELPGGHREVQVICLVLNSAGSIVGRGIGSATTMESKYRFRNERTTNPIPQSYWKSRDPELIGGRGCFVKKVEKGKYVVFRRAEHDNPADFYNTILKMAKKRAFVDATLATTAVSDVFEQDLEDDIDQPHAEDVPDPDQSPQISDAIPPNYDEEQFYRGGQQGHPATQQTSDKQASEPDESAKPIYAQADFEANKENWRRLIQSGRRNPTQIISTIEQKYSVPESIKDAICDLDK